MNSDPIKQSISIWIEDLRAGDNRAAHEIWDRYFDRLVRHANRRLGNASRRFADEEDVAVSVFESLCEGAAEGRFKKLSNRDDLWKLLVAMTRMKAVDQIRRQTAKKRGGTELRGESIVDGPTNDQTPAGFDQFLGEDPSPEFLVAMDEQYQVLMNALPDESQRQVAKLRMDGFANEEISKSLDISVRSVERKLRIIRDTWEHELSQ